MTGSAGSRRLLGWSPVWDVQDRGRWIGWRCCRNQDRVSFDQRCRTRLECSIGAAVSADRYALQSLDLMRDGKYSAMRKLAVVSSPDKWKVRNLAVVRKFADEIAEDMEAVPMFQSQGIAQALTALRAA